VTKRLRVGVVFGGKSGEHEVSLQSAASIISSLDADEYEVVPIAIEKSGRWQVGPEALKQLASSVQSEVALSQEVAMIPPTLGQEIDVIIPVLHGSYGEDGTIQGMLEMLDLPYVGAGVLASAVGMDKVFMKKLFAAAGLPQVNYTFYTRGHFESYPDAVMDDIESNLGYPCFVKPANLGSSVGISKAKDRATLMSGLELAARFDRKIIVEQGVEVRELEVAVLGNDEPLASVAGEVVPSNEFYDYNAKYLSGESVLMIPAQLSNELMLEIRELAIRAFQALDCTGLARVDFFVEKNTNRVLVNEINTMPGFTKFSMYPKLWEATGLPYKDLVRRLVELAVERYKEKRRNQTNYTIES